MEEGIAENLPLFLFFVIFHKNRKKIFIYGKRANAMKK
jgi:hypothetical protein